MTDKQFIALGGVCGEIILVLLGISIEMKIIAGAVLLSFMLGMITFGLLLISLNYKDNEQH